MIIPRSQRTSQERERGRRILVEYDPLWGFGDLLCSEPMVRGLGERFPRAEIRYRGHAGNAAFCPVYAGEAAPWFTPDFTVSVRLFHAMSTEAYARLEALPSLVDHMCAYAGVSPVDRSPRLHLDAAGRQLIAGLGLDALPRPLVALCADGSDVYRSWPSQHFQDLARDLVRRGATVIEIGSREKLGVGIDLVGALSIRQSAAVLSACDLFVGNNSGLCHYAQAAEVPSVVFFSLALPQRFVHDRRLVVPVQNDEFGLWFDTGLVEQIPRRNTFPEVS